MDADIETLVDRADLDGLIRVVDALCESRSWPLILRTRDLCRSATRTGRQVWPIATLCEYRLALHAPAEWACKVVDDTSSRFTIGPLTEVVAQNHSWAELRDVLPPGPHRDIVAHERVVRGDAVRIDDSGDSGTGASRVLDLPLHICEWEPVYPVAEYSDDGVNAPCPSDQWSHEWTQVTANPNTPELIDDEETDAALRALVEPWTAASAGRSRCVVVEGGLDTLATALDRSVIRTTSLSPDQALQWLAWCGASSGSHGRRRGSAAGRFNMWWLVAVLADLESEWEDEADFTSLATHLGRVTREWEWHRIDLGERHSYDLSIAVHDNDENLTFGLFAFDDPL